MTVLDEIEVSLEKYFDDLEFICQGYTWNTKLPLDVLLNAFKEIGTKIKSYHSLYPESKIRETPGDQLLKFISSINSFLNQTQEYFTIHLLTALETINKNLFSILTSEQSSKDLLKTFDYIQLPEIDLNFTRFFYSQVLPRWVDTGENYFNLFLSDVQKINEIVPLLKTLFSEDVLSDLRKNNPSALQQKIGPIADKLEQQSLILPGSLSEKMKSILIDFLTFAQKYSDVVQLQYHLDTINRDLLNKDLLFTHDFTSSCKEQIELIRTIKKKIDVDTEFFQRYHIDESVYNTKITEIEQMIFSHNNILEKITTLQPVKSISIDILIADEFKLIELLKNNLNFFVPDFKKIFIAYIENMLYLIEWWNNVKKSLLQRSQLFQLMFENVPEDSNIQIIREIKNKYFKNLFKEKKFFYSFIEEVVGDLLPIFDHFQVVHKSIFNALEDLSKWDSLEKTQPIKNSKSILEAVIQFFKRWNASELQKSFESKLDLYTSEFIPFFETITAINILSKDLAQKRFSKPDQAIQKADLILSKLQDSEKAIYNLFSSNLELIDVIDKLKNEVMTQKVIIVNFDKLNEEVFSLLAEKFDSASIKPFLKLMRENIDKFPASKERISNKEKLKVLTLYNFIIILINIDEYLNDSILMTVTNIASFNESIRSIQSSQTILSDFSSLVSQSKKSKTDQFASNVKTLLDSIALEWIKIAKKTNVFLGKQTNKIPLSDRKTLLSQLADYKPKGNLFTFKWPIFENHFITFNKKFFPTFILFFKQLYLLEEHWQSSILRPPIKNIETIKKDLIKEIEKINSLRFAEDTSVELIVQINEILYKRVELLKNSDKESFPAEQMKSLLL